MPPVRLSPPVARGKRAGYDLPVQLLTQADVIARMTPEQKLRAAEKLYWSARGLKAAALRAKQPDWSDEQIERAVRDAFLFHHG